MWWSVHVYGVVIVRHATLLRMSPIAISTGLHHIVATTAVRAKTVDVVIVVVALLWEHASVLRPIMRSLTARGSCSLRPRPNAGVPNSSGVGAWWDGVGWLDDHAG